LSGSAYICTPRGEIIRPNLDGTMCAHLNRFTDGEAITLDMSYSPILTAVFSTEHRPILNFRGQWQNPNMVLTDTGSLSYAFQSDGTVDRGHDPNRRPTSGNRPAHVETRLLRRFQVVLPRPRT
jgi:hypothetical protein